MHPALAYLELVGIDRFLYKSVYLDPLMAAV